jgi:hypothetical protein
VSGFGANDVLKRSWGGFGTGEPVTTPPISGRALAHPSQPSNRGAAAAGARRRERVGAPKGYRGMS